jgi:hypothetical protein
MFDEFDDDGASWYCDHDVPNGCTDCARVEGEARMLEAMTPEERDVYFGGTFEERFAPFGPEWEREREAAS